MMLLARSRTLLLSASAAVAAAAVAIGVYSADGAGAAPLPAGSAACTSISTLSYSPAQASAALKYWTPARIAATRSFSVPAIAALTGHAAAKAGQPAIGTECAATSRTTSVAAAPAAHASAVHAAAAATSSAGYPTIGKLTFNADGLLSLSCTGTVIQGTSATNNEELVLTAAHCIEGVTAGIPYTSTDLAFSPEWHNSTSPLGTWSVAKVFLNSGWMHCSVPVFNCGTNPQDDYAIMVMNPQNGKGIGTVTGADGWSASQPATVPGVTVAGIPSSGTQLLTTTTTATTVTESGADYRTATTPGYTDGTSGGPWLTGFNATTGLGTLIADTGGYEEGGPASGSPSYADIWSTPFATVVSDAVAYEG